MRHWQRTRNSPAMEILHPLGHESSAPAVVSRRLGSPVSVLPSSLGHPLVTRVWVSSNSRVRIYYNDYDLDLVPWVSHAHEFVSVCACNVRYKYTQ